MEAKPPNVLPQSAASLRWLEAILKERTGADFVLSTDRETSNFVISIEGSEKNIYVDYGNSDFSLGSSRHMPTAFWDPASEGYHSQGGTRLPMPGTSKLIHQVITNRNGEYSLHYDILGHTLWCLSRAEEINSTTLDQHGRYPATASHAYNNGYLDRPIVDEWLEILKQLIRKTWPSFEIKESNFKMLVSHDVDSASLFGLQSFTKLLRSMASSLVLGDDMRSVLLAPYIWHHSKSELHPADPFNSFDWIMDMSERRGATSAFYFICGRTDPTKDASYEIEHPAIAKLLKKIHARGHEIGLHPSYNTYKSPELIVAEARRLKSECEKLGIHQSQWGGRMHYLRWETPTALYGWENANMTYDSSLGYADSPGFRCGTCFEYPAFDPVAQRQLNLRIRPLVAMECTVMDKRYLGLGNGEAALEKFKQLKNACRKVGGNFTTLWHNSVFNNPQNRELYQAVLDA